MGNRDIISTSIDRTAKQWDVQSGKIIKTWSSSSQIDCFAMDTTGSQFVTGHKSGDMRVWSINANKQQTILENVHPDKIVCC